MSTVRAKDVKSGMVLLAETGLSKVVSVERLEGGIIKILWDDNTFSLVPGNDLLHKEED